MSEHSEDSAVGPVIPRSPENSCELVINPAGSDAGYAIVEPGAHTLVHSLSLDPSDNTPTIISKAQPQALPTENVLAGVLRGRTLAHFQLIEPIGVGGMAAVMRATDLLLDRTVALKILPPEMAIDPENVRRFHQEARSAAKLDHDNIARAFFCGEDQGLHFIAFEYVEGENLRTILDAKGPLPVAEAVHYVLQIATGLVHAAQRGVVHRDIKPSNIIITPDGKAKLVDMGLARSLEPHADAGLTQSGVTLGTFDYISPEQALEPRDADVRSDIYSLGCTFYHTLTGQPPVPEGTAARKLHHHQNVDPWDPRQLNSDVPHGVAVIVARMIAKEAKERYQRPEHLVQDLSVCEQGLNNWPANTKGIPYLAFPAPPPSNRYFGLALALGVAAVIALVLVLNQFAPVDKSVALFDPTVKAPAPEVATNNTLKDAGIPTVPNKTDVTDKGADSSSAEPAVYDEDNPTGERLLDFLQRNQGAKKIEIRLAGDVRVPVNEKSTYGEGRSGIGLFAKAENIVIRAKHRVQRPTVTFAYSGWVKPTTPIWASAFTLDCETAVVEGLRFRVEAYGAEIAMTPLLLRNAKEATINDCSFFQSGPTYSETGRLSSLAVQGVGPSATRSTLNLNDCYFGSISGNQGLRFPETTKPGFDSLTQLNTSYPVAHEAISLGCPASVFVTNCAFGPHTKLVRGERDSSSSVQMSNCSIMTSTDWTGFAWDSGAVCERLKIQQCLFSNLRQQGSPKTAGGSQAVLVRQEAGSPVLGRVDLLDSCFHDLDALWIRNDRTAVTLKDLPLALGTSVSTKDSREFSMSPWSALNPLANLLDTVEDRNLQRAFLLRTDVADLRMTGRFNEGMVGAAQCTWGPTYDERLPSIVPDHPPLIAKKNLIVDPANNNSGGGIYSTLNAALEDAKAGDTILIRATGLFPISPSRLDKASTELTIKPFDRTYKPVITLSGETADADVAFFSLQDGKLSLEGLEFLLTPRANKFPRLRNFFPLARDTQCLVRITGNGTCTLKECVVTLEDAKNASLAVARIPDSSGLMKTDKANTPSAPIPHLRLEDCFVRGDGELISSRASRPFDLEAKNSLVAVSGSFLSLEAKSEDPALVGGSAISIKLTSVTAYLKSHLVRLKGEKDGKGLIPVNFESVADCLFVSAGNKTLVHLEGMDIADERIRSQIQWDGKNNLFSNFTQLLDLQSTGDEMMTMTNMAVPYTWEKWIKTYGDNDQKQERVTFQNPLSSENLEQARPMNFQPTEKTQQAFGASVARLPIPAGE